jgi:hypothetical protein
MILKYYNSKFPIFKMEDDNYKNDEMEAASENKEVFVSTIRRDPSNSSTFDRETSQQLRNEFA